MVRFEGKRWGALRARVPKAPHFFHFTSCNNILFCNNFDDYWIYNNDELMYARQIVQINRFCDKYRTTFQNNSIASLSGALEGLSPYHYLYMI